MKLNPNQFRLDCEQYRLNNGRRALQTILFANKSFVVKHDHPEKVVLFGVADHKELELTPAEFEQNAIWYMLDEMVLYLGSREQQESARATMDTEFEAIRLCLYGNQNPA